MHMKKEECESKLIWKPTCKINLDLWGNGGKVIMSLYSLYS